MDERDLQTIVTSVTEKVSENLHILSNEPSLALFRMQEHARRTLPLLVEKKNEATKLQAGLQGRYYDLEHALKSVDNIIRATSTLQRIHELCRSTMFHKQQLDYERTRRIEVRPGMAHTDSNDSLVQELRKSKSLGALKPCPGSASDLTSECSRSTLSTPMSERPPEDDLEVWINQRLPKMSLDEAPSNSHTTDDASSSTTSGADSIASNENLDEELCCDNYNNTVSSVN